MFKKLILILTMLITLPTVFASLSESELAIGVKRNADISWLINSYAQEYTETSGYQATWSINIDVDKKLYSDNPFVDYAYIEEYEWYKPPFIDSYDRDKTPILISSCLVVSDKPDYPLVPVIWSPFGSSDFIEEDNPDSSLEMWVDIKRGFKQFKDYNDDGGDYGCWSGGFTTYCYVYLDSNYVNNDAVQDYYNWDSDNPPNLKDVADIDLFDNCDENSEGTYCMVNIHYPWNIITDVGDTKCVDNYWWYETGGIGLWNSTSSEFGDIEDATGSLNMSGIEIENLASSSDEADDAGGSGTGNEDTSGYQYTKVQGYLIEKEIAIQQVDYLSTVLNIMKLLFSFLLLIFYIIEFSIIIYIPTKLVPNMFNKMMDIIKKAGKLK